MQVPGARQRTSNLGRAGGGFHPNRLLWFGLAAIVGCSDAPLEPVRKVDRRPVVLCLGDSITAGYGLDPDRAYPALLQEKVDAADLGFRVHDAGTTGETTSGGRRRLDWLLEQFDVAVVLLALGGNDGLRGIDVPTIEENLRAMIDRTRELRPDARVILAGMQAPPSMGEVFTAPFREVFPRVAREMEVPFVPFLLEGVGGEDDMNQSDGIHPNEAGQARIAENVWPVLEPVLRGLPAAR